MLAVLTILAGMTRVVTCTARRENIERHLTDEKSRQQDLGNNNEES
jgi:hypothetical protein